MVGRGLHSPRAVVEGPSLASCRSLMRQRALVTEAIPRLFRLARGVFSSFTFPGKTTRSFGCGSRTLAASKIYRLAFAQDDSFLVRWCAQNQAA